MDRTSVEKVSSQTINEVADRSDVEGGMKTRYGGLIVKLYVYCLSYWGLSLSILVMSIKRLKPHVCCNSPEICKLLAGFLCVFYLIITYTYCSSEKY